MEKYLTVITSVGICVGGVLAFLWAVISGFRKRSVAAQLKMAEAQTNLLEVVQAEAKAWKQRYESEHEEFLTYRQKTHDNVQMANATVLKLTADNADLKAKTDLTPVLQFHQAQSEINRKVVLTLDTVVQTSNMILTRLSAGNGEPAVAA